MPHLNEKDLLPSMPFLNEKDRSLLRDNAIETVGSVTYPFRLNVIPSEPEQRGPCLVERLKITTQGPVFFRFHRSSSF